MGPFLFFLFFILGAFVFLYWPEPRYNDDEPTDHFYDLTYPYK